MTLHALGDLVGMSHTAVHRYEIREAGEKGSIYHADVKTLLKLADVLGVTPAQILGAEPFPREASQLVDRERMGQVSELISRYAKDHNVIFSGKAYNDLQFAIYDFVEHAKIETAEINTGATLAMIASFVSSYESEKA